MFETAVDSEASAPKAYSRGGEVLCLVASPQPVFGCLRLLFTKATQWVSRGVDEIGVCLQQRSVPGPKAHKEDRVRTIVNGLAIFRP